jgi:hypothetical protein
MKGIDSRITTSYAIICCLTHAPAETTWQNYSSGVEGLLLLVAVLHDGTHGLAAVDLELEFVATAAERQQAESARNVISTREGAAAVEATALAHHLDAGLWFHDLALELHTEAAAVLLLRDFAAYLVRLEAA